MVFKSKHAGKKKKVYEIEGTLIAAKSRTEALGVLKKSKARSKKIFGY